MSISKIDPQTALVIVDLQHGIVALNTCHPVSSVIDNCCKLIAAFRQLALPIVFVNVNGTAPGRTDNAKSVAQRPPNWSQLIDVLQPQQGDILITKKTWSAFTNTELHSKLTSRNISQLVIGGIATSMGVESTARQGFELGYNVTLPTDAITDFDINIHNNSLSFIFPKIAETGTTEDVITTLGE